MKSYLDFGLFKNESLDWIVKEMEHIIVAFRATSKLLPPLEKQFGELK